MVLFFNIAASCCEPLREARRDLSPPGPPCPTRARRRPRTPLRTTKHPRRSPTFPEQAEGHVVARKRLRSSPIRDLSVLYGDFRAVRDVTVDVHAEITALIGPQAGQTRAALLKPDDDFIETASGGTVSYHGSSSPPRCQRHTKSAAASEVFRSRTVPTSIYATWPWATPRRRRKRGELAGIVERSCHGAGSGTRQGPPEAIGTRALRRPAQRLCIARAIALSPRY